MQREGCDVADRAALVGVSCWHIAVARPVDWMHEHDDQPIVG
ncbi:hypothetical protein HNQ07_002162 [Deinococcus metalli]|uniref:Uncharacterized protein n=1 Tax=Deinococcus metalli TaxID=1141878 RepID=A0A7W8NRB2_9DEIO|nr:hypothetical protein [Deinococcus metalli]